MWILVAGSILAIAVLAVLVFAIVQKQRAKKAKRKEETALKGIAAGIAARLHAACPGSKWRWVCRPAGFAINGGIARIEVIDPTGNVGFIDACLSASGYMALYVLNVVELAASDAVMAVVSDDAKSAEDTVNITVPPVPNANAKPHDEESLAKWYNIVLIDSLTSLINNLHVEGEVCLYIDQDGKAYVEDDGGNSVVHEFGELPDISLWDSITEKLGIAGLYAEVREENRIFISWE